MTEAVINDIKDKLAVMGNGNITLHVQDGRVVKLSETKVTRIKDG